MRILLASGSFLKNFIMEKSKLPYETIPADIDETVFDNQPVGERVVSLAEAKCRKVAEQYPDAIVIAADTLTAGQDGTVFSKPEPGTDPIEAALSLSGKTIDIYTGCCVYTPTKGHASTLASATMTYQTFDRAQIERLADKDNPQIRSGALGIFFDAPGFTLIERIEGSYTGAFGLPMEFVYAQINE